MAESSIRAPISLPTYALGDGGKPGHFTEAITREAATIEAKALEVGDAAFILRSDRKWSYSMLTEKVKGEGDSHTLTFELDREKNVKRFPEGVWGKYIRVIKVDAAEVVKLEAEEAAKQTNEEALKEEDKPDEVNEEEPKKEDGENEESSRADIEKKDEKTASFGESMTELGAMFSGFIDSVSKKIEEKKVEAANKTEEAKPDTAAAAVETSLSQFEKTTEEAKPDATDAAVETKEPKKTGESEPTTIETKVSSWLSSLGLFGKKTEETKPAAIADAAVETKDEEREPTEYMPAAEDTSTPEPVPEPLKLIKLLQTPLKLYKAATMTEDPAAAALANTSFAEDQDQAYGSLKNHGVVVVEKDASPATHAALENLERERYYPGYEKQGIAIIETNCSVVTECE